MGNLKIEYKPNYTYEDYRNWEGRWELIDGIPFAMTPLPRIEHQILCTNIILELDKCLKKCKECRVVSPVDWRIENGDDNNVFQPDVLVVCKPISGAYITEPPEIIFEVLSPPNIDKDRIIKFRKYEENGVNYYCIVDIDSKVIDVFKLEKGKYKNISKAGSEKIYFELNKCNFEFDYSKIWE